MKKNIYFATLLLLACSSAAIAQSLLNKQQLTISAADIALMKSSHVDEIIKINSLSAEMKFKKIELYNENTRFIIDTGTQQYRQPNPQRLFFISYNTPEKTALSVDLKSKTIKGFLRIKADNYHFNSTLKSGFSFHTTKKHDSFDCLNDDLQQWELEFPIASKLNVESLIDSLEINSKGPTPIYQATIAVDTDNEFLWNKFSNNSTAAIDWIESMFLNMNVIYESEVNLRLLIGTTIIRIDNTPVNDPDFNADPDSFNNNLTDFVNYWKINQTSVNRVFAMLLTGRGISNGSFSGVAYVNVYCSNNFGYSFNKLGSSFPASSAALFVGHELGHNFGSSHTHCERLANNGTDFVDHCYFNNNNSCFTGTTSCPAGGQGTMMSYCHAPASGFDGGGPALGPPGNCNTSTDVHSLIATKMSNLIQNNYPNCIELFTEFEDLIFVDSFEN